jgi:hypothetical protein
MATKAQKLEAVTKVVSLIGDHSGIFKTITKTEAITFIRDIMFTLNNDEQGTDSIDVMNHSSQQLSFLLSGRLNEIEGD